MSERPNIIRPEEAEDPIIKNRLNEAEESWYGDAAFFGAMAHCPEIFENIVTTLDSFEQGEHIDTNLLELMRLKIAEVHQCAYCATVRTLTVRDSIKSKEDAIFGKINEAALTRREYLAVSLAEHLSEDPHRITEEFFADLRKEFTEAEVIELLLFGGIEVGLDRFCIALELQPTTDSPYPNEVDYPLENPRPKTD